jgi:integrase
MPHRDLSAREVAALPPGKTYRTARNLYLRHEPPNKSWIFIYQSPLTGRHTELGLGSARDITFTQAKLKADQCRLAVRHGHCPVTEKRAARTPRLDVVTFAVAAERCIAARRDGWTNAEHRRQWERTLRDFAGPLIGALPVNKVDTAAVMRVLEPHWQVRTVTAMRLRNRIEAVLDYAKAAGWRTGENPARWKGHLDHLLAAPKKLAPVKHHAALDWREAPALYTTLTARPGLTALALRFIAVTAARRGEAVDATWLEIDLKRAIWTIPAARMKGGAEHTIPLSTAALDVLKELAKLRRDDLLFPGTRQGKPISATGLFYLLREVNAGITTHGLRSTFRSWCADHRVARELAEAALAHEIKSATEAAYQRSDVLGPRRAIMERWGRFLAGQATKRRDMAA